MKLSYLKEHIVFFTVLTLLFFPVFVEAGGHSSMGGCCGGSTTYYTYPTTNYANSGRTGSLLGLYPGFGGYSTGLYGNTYGSPYLGTGGFGYPLGGYGTGLGYGYPFTQQVTSNEYTVEQSQTYYIPGGSITNSVSESTQISSIPWGGYGLGTSLYGGLYGGGLYGSSLYGGGLYGGGLYGGLGTYGGWY